MGALYYLDPNDDDGPFPPVELAMREPDGLLAMGGNLSPARLINAYRHGVFPWYSADQPILWWSPDPRSVLLPEHLKVSRSLRKTLRKGAYRLTMDTAFRGVVEACAQPRTSQSDTWITSEMIEAYVRLHAMGIAHSVEAWQDHTLVGGLYGIGIGRVYFGESMFSRRSDASKTAFVHLVHQLRTWGYALIDCQVQSAHLDSLGAHNIPRGEFIRLLERYCGEPGYPAPWTFEPGVLEAVKQ